MNYKEMSVFEIIESLKCCGNCKLAEEGWEGELKCTEYKDGWWDIVSANNVCEHWLFDEKIKRLNPWEANTE